MPGTRSYSLRYALDGHALLPILPAHIEDTVRAIAELHVEHHRRASAVQRVVDRSVATISRPRFVGWLTVAILIWTVGNALLSLRGKALEGPPWPLLQDVGAALALYITVLIIITQRRENELAEHRAQLTLELAILNEQKSAKVIELLEELRRDSPTLPNRVDEEAEALAIPADPQTVLEAIRETHEEMLANVLDAPPQG